MDNSETSTAEDRDDISEEERNVRIFATQMLKSRIFLGQFQERRYVEPIQGYRDVIVVNNSENELKKDIDIVRKRLREFYKNCWIGLTDPTFIGTPHGYCIWIESENNPLGYYWYRIRGVKFRRNEIILKLKVVRPMTDNPDTLSTQSNENFEDSISNIMENFSWEDFTKNIKLSTLEYFLWFFTNIFTVNNIKEAVTFISVLFVTTVALFFKAVAFFMDFSLRFMRETSYFVQSATPVMISVVNMIGKIVGGFYLLILAIWRDSRQPPARNSYPAIQMSSYKSRPSLSY